MHTARIVLEHPRAEVVERTIRPESGQPVPRTSIALTRQDDKLLLDISSRDVNALRAAMNSYLRWMDMAVRITDRIGD